MAIRRHREALPRSVQSFPREPDIYQERSRAACAVSGDFNDRRRCLAKPIADGASRLSLIVAGRLVEPSQEEAGAGAVRLGEGDSHFSSAARPCWLSRL